MNLPRWVLVAWAGFAAGVLVTVLAAKLAAERIYRPDE